MSLRYMGAGGLSALVFRCGWWFVASGQIGDITVDQGKEKRITPRYACGGNVRINTPGVPRSQPGHILDLSLGGCLLQLQHEGLTFRQGAPIELTIQSRGAVFRVQGVVSKRTEKVLIGVMFYTMSPRSKAELEGLIKTMTDDSASEEGTAAQLDAASQSTGRG